MKKITEAIVRKDKTVNKIQFDKEWFYSLEDMEDFLNEDLSGVEAVTLPMDIYGEILNVKCATWEDIERFRQKEPLEDFRGSVLRKK
jgi:Zn-finger domain-containing protein